MHSEPIDGVLAGWLAEHPSVPGVIVLVRDANGEARACAGFADRARTEPITVAHAFRIASNTKTVVAAAAMSLVEAGAFALDDAIAPRLPVPVREMLARRYDLDAITIRMLLHHTSGIAAHDTESHDGPSSPYLSAVNADPAHRWTAAEQIEFSVDRFPPTNAPGAAMLYTDTGYVVLGQVIEHVTQLPLAAVVRERGRFDALGLRATWWESLEPPPAPAPPRARVQLGGDEWESVDCSIDCYGGGGLVSTVADLTTWWRALFHHEIVPAARLAEMQAPLAPSAESHGDAGLGLFRRSVAGREWWTHSGYWGSIVLHDDAADLTVSAFRNQSAVRTAALEPVYAQILDAFLTGAY